MNREPESAPTDALLLSKVAEGDKEAFSLLTERHWRRFYSLAFRMTGSKADAEDIVQDGFVKLWKGSANFDPARGTRFTTWFYRIMVNLSLDAIKRKHTLPLGAEMEPRDTEALSADDRLGRKRRRRELERAIRELPERQRIALNLCFYEGVSNKEAAEVLEIEVKALESLLIRAKSTLRKVVQEGKGQADG